MIPGKRHHGQLFRSSITRMLLAIGLIVAGYLALLFYFLDSYTSRLEEMKRSELIRVVDLGLAALEPFRDGSYLDEYSYSIEQIRREGAIALRELTYRYRLGENYLFMITNDGLVLVDPFARDREFTNQANAVDAGGKLYVQEMIAAATSPDGAGFVSYDVSKSEGDASVRKITYVVSLPEWDAFIGAGFTMEEFERENRQFLLLSLLITSLLLGFILVIIFMTLRPTVKSYRVLLDAFGAVSSDPEARPDVNPAQFREDSEARQLLTGFDAMLGEIDKHKKAHHEATVAERNRLARELHDAVSQTLFSASLIADVLPALWETNPETAREQLQDLAELTRGAHAELRTLLVELRPERLVRADLQELIQQLGDALTGRYRIPVTITIEGDCQPPADVKIALFRIAQEALNNIIKHANASSVKITIECADGDITFSIGDDGAGFDPATVLKGGSGLLTMRERAESIGATFSIRTSPGEGTLLTLLWPG